MKKHHFTLLLAFTLCNLSGKYTTTYAQKPMGKVTFIEARKVHIDDSFWSPKMELWKRVTIDDVLNKFEGKHVNEPGNHNTLSNFDRVTQGYIDLCGRSTCFFFYPQAEIHFSTFQ